MRGAVEEAAERAELAEDETSEADPEVVAEALGGLRTLLGELRAGRRLSRYDAGSARLLAAELQELLGREVVAA